MEIILTFIARLGFEQPASKLEKAPPPPKKRYDRQAL